MKDPSQVRVSGPLGPYAEGFGAELARQGYAVSSAVNQLKLVAHLSHWMTAEALSVAELVPVQVDRYVAARRAARYRHNLSQQGLWPLVSYLRGLGVLAEPTSSGPETPQERLLDDYASYLAGERSPGRRPQPPCGSGRDRGLFTAVAFVNPRHAADTIRNAASVEPDM